MRAIPNVILLDPYEDSYRAIDVSELILTICSTMGYEGALLGKPVIVFSRVFYQRCSNVRYCSDATRLGADIKDALGAVQWDFDETLRFMATVIANSYPGVRGNPHVDPKVMQPQNIEHWVEAFSDYVQRCGDG